MLSQVTNVDLAIINKKEINKFFFLTLGWCPMLVQMFEVAVIKEICHIFVGGIFDL